MESNKMDQFLREKLDNTSLSAQEDWEKISTRVSFMNFFKFGFHHYNIYYTLAIIVSFAGIMSAVFAFDFNQTYYSKNSQPQVQKSIGKSVISTVPAIQAAPTAKAPFVKAKKIHTVNKVNQANLEPIENIKVQEVVAASFDESLSNSEKETSSLLALESRKTDALNNSAPASIKENVRPIPFARKWFVEIYSQPVMSDALTLSAGNANPDFENIKNKQSYGIMLGMKSYRLWLQTGLEFTFLSKSFSNSFIRNEIIQVKSYETITRVVYGLESGKEIRSIKDSVLVASEKAISTKYNHNHINSYKFLEIPIYLGYSVRYSKFSFVTKGGLIFDLYKSAKGSVFTDAQSLDLKDVSFYKSYFTLYSSLGIYYKLNPFMSFLVEPNLRLHINGQSSSEAFMIRTNKFSSGIKMGFAVDF